MLKSQLLAEVNKLFQGNAIHLPSQSHLGKGLSPGGMDPKLHIMDTSGEGSHLGTKGDFYILF